MEKKGNKKQKKKSFVSFRKRVRPANSHKKVSLKQRTIPLPYWGNATGTISSFSFEKSCGRKSRKEKWKDRFRKTLLMKEQFFSSLISKRNTRTVVGHLCFKGLSLLLSLSLLSHTIGKINSMYYVGQLAQPQPHECHPIQHQHAALAQQRQRYHHQSERNSFLGGSARATQGR